MSLDQWGIIAEIVASISVIATLWFLVVELRRSTQQSKKQAQEAVTQLRIELLKPLYDDEEVSELLWQGIFATDRTEPTKWARISMYLYNIFVLLELSWLHTIHGEFDDRRFSGQQLPVRWWLEKPGVQRWWKTRPAGFTDEFCNHIDRELSAVIAEQCKEASNEE